MRGLSFREYLAYENILSCDPVSLDELLSEHVAIASRIQESGRILEHFHNYLRVGYYPFFKSVRRGYYQRLQSVVNQVIDVDYPNIDEVTVSTCRKTKKLMMILAERVPQMPKMNELYRELETDRNQGLKMLYALQRGGLLMLLGDNTKSLDNLSRPDKIYLNNPTLMYALTPRVDVGTLRETFFLNQVSQSHDVRYPVAGDFFVDRRFLFEVGGKGKTFEQIKDQPDSFLALDDTEVGRGNRIPLWMFGLLY